MEQWTQYFSTILPLIILFVFFFFLVIRPQQKRQKKMEEERSKLQIGDEVVTHSGFYGIVSAIDDKNVVLELLPDFNKAMVVRQAIAHVITKDEAEETEEASEAAEQEALEDIENDVEGRNESVDDDNSKE